METARRTVRERASGGVAERSWEDKNCPFEDDSFSLWQKNKTEAQGKIISITDSQVLS